MSDDLLVYRKGQWVTVPHPLAGIDDADFVRAMNTAGYSRAAYFEPGGEDAQSLGLVVWASGGDPGRPWQRAVDRSAPQYLVEIDFAAAGTGELVGVASLVELMNLLATWTPVVQAGLACDESVRLRDAV